MKRKPLILALATACGLLAACGFEPVYGTHGAGGESVAAQLNTVAIDNIPERRGQMLRNDLIDQMYGQGRPQQPAYRLVVNLRMTEEDLGIQANATSTRSMINMYGDYTLQDMQGRALLKGTAHSISSFNTLVDEYGNLAALNDAIARTINEVSQQIVNRMSLYFAEKDEGHEPPPPPAASTAAGPAAGIPQAETVTIPNAVSLTQPTSVSTRTPNSIAAPTAGSQPAAATPAAPTEGPMPDPRLAPTY